MAVATPTFTGFRPEAIQFLADLAANNERAWFQPRKGEYESLLKEPLEALIVALAERFEARGIPLRADPAKSPFRIYRDVRFSKDKSPYKTNIGASFPWVGETDRPTAARDRTRRTSTRAAATSTSSRARSTSAAGSGTPRSRGSTPSGAGSRTIRMRSGALVDDRRRSRRRSEPQQRRPRAPAGPGRLSGRPPGGGPVQAEGRRLRPAALGRGCDVAAAAGCHRGLVRGGACR